MINAWERAVAWVYRRQVLFFLVTVALIAGVTLYGL